MAMVLPLLVARMSAGVPLCVQEPVMVLGSPALGPPISAQTDVLEPPLFTGETRIARWNSGEPVRSGSATVFPLIFTLLEKSAPAPMVSSKWMAPSALICRISLFVMVTLAAPCRPGRMPMREQQCAMPDPDTPLLQH